MWAIQAEAILEVYEFLDIVRRTEQNPTPAVYGNGL